MDRHFSASLGVPTIINDNDITASIGIPASAPLQERFSPTLKLHVQLSRLHSYIINCECTASFPAISRFGRLMALVLCAPAIYKETRTQMDSFLEATRDILQSLAETAQEIEHIVSLRITNLVDSMSKDTRNVALLYHQVSLQMETHFHSFIKGSRFSNHASSV